MIEVKIPGIRHGRAYIAADYAKGSFCKKDGVFSSVNIAALPAGQKDVPGFAYAGAAKLTQVGTAAAGHRGTLFPINKLLFKPEGSDSTDDTISAGSGVIFYQGGQYETDQYTAISGTAGGDFGDNLEVTTAGKLTETSQNDASTQIVAKVIVTTFGDEYNDEVKGTKYEKDVLWYELLS